MPDVNPDILRWARETAGLSLEDAAMKLQIGPARGLEGSERLDLLEKGAQAPSQSMLTKMSKQYRRPLLTFYLISPPIVASRGEDFRTLPEEYAQKDLALVDALLRDVSARQNMVRALLEVEDEAINLPFVGSFDQDRGAERLAENIATKLDFDLAQFRNGDTSGRHGFAYLRERSEAAGIFVLLIGNLGSHHSTLDVELFRGFALADPVAPFIVINDQDSEAAWSFTLLHELAHIWLGKSGVSGSKPDTSVEVFCNDVAGRILLPNNEINAEGYLRNAEQNEIIERIGEIADAANVSRSMVAYKLFRADIIDRNMWVSITGLFRRQWLASRREARERARQQPRGPSYYVVKRHRIGNRLLSLSKRMLEEGALSPSKAAAILGVKPNSVYPLTSQ